jgi:hypothetical protein
VVHASNIVLPNPWSVLAFAMVNNSLLRLTTMHCPALDGRKMMIVDQQLITLNLSECQVFTNIYKHFSGSLWFERMPIRESKYSTLHYTTNYPVLSPTACSTSHI